MALNGRKEAAVKNSCEIEGAACSNNPEEMSLLLRYWLYQILQPNSSINSSNSYYQWSKLGTIQSV